MKIEKKYEFLLLVSLIINLVLLNACAADQGTSLTIFNQTDKYLTIYINKDLRQGKIKPFESSSYMTDAPIDAQWAPRDYLVEAKNDKGQIVYSKSFTREELQNNKYKIVISQSDELTMKD